MFFTCIFLAQNLTCDVPNTVSQRARDSGTAPVCSHLSPAGDERSRKTFFVNQPLSTSAGVSDAARGRDIGNFFLLSTFFSSCMSCQEAIGQVGLGVATLMGDSVATMEKEFVGEPNR